MYQIYADSTLIYDSTLEDYKIGKGQISLETNKSGSFVFSVYPDHFYYDSFVRLKTVITVYKSGRIVIRGRILNDVTDYWNNKVITCEGELGFLNDSIIRPYSFTGTPADLFAKFIEDHNAQVDEFKRFKIGIVTVVDPNNDISRINTEYETTNSNLNSRLIEDTLGGYFYITHGEDGTDPIPTLNYLADFTKVSTQRIEFGSNLKNYTKTVNAGDIATAIIPLGATIDDGNSDTEDPRLTIASVNDGIDYVYNEEGVALYGWIFQTMTWDDVTVASDLKVKAEAYLDGLINQAITIELTAIDLHLLDPDIESINVGDYVRVMSYPHNFDSTLLCNKQTIDLLKPENDTLTLGYTYSTFTETNSKVVSSISNISSVKAGFSAMSSQLISINNTVANNKTEIDTNIRVIATDVEAVATAVSQVDTDLTDHVNNTNNPHRVTRDQIGASGKSVKLSLTILASDWTGSSVPYTNTIAVTGATTDNNIEIVLPDTVTQEEITAYMSALILNGSQTEDAVTLNCWGTVPEIDLPVVVIVRGD